MTDPRPSVHPESLRRFAAPLRAALGHVARIAFGAAAIWLLIRSGALKPQLLAAAVRNHPFLYGVAFFLYFVVLQAMACGRWFWLLRSARVPIRAREVLRLHMTGLFFSGFLPGGTGGDLVKGYYLMKGRSKADGAAALGTMVVDRIVGLFGLVGVAAAATLASMDVWRSSPLLAAQSSVVLASGLGCLVLTLVYLLPWKRKAARTSGKAHDTAHMKTRGFLAELAGALATFRKTPGVFLGTIALSMAVHGCLIVIYALCARSLGVDLPLRLHAYVGPILTFANGIPISPAGLGVGEAAGMVLYKAVGVLHGQAEIPALVHSLGLLTALLCAPAYLLRRDKPGREP